jgi:hypothetical protein
VSVIGKRIRSIGSHRLHGKAAASEKTGKILPLREKQNIVVVETKLSPKIPYPPLAKKWPPLHSPQSESSSSGRAAIEWKRAAEQVKY